MSHNWSKITVFSAIGAACSLAVWLGSTSAKEETSVLVDTPSTPSADAQQGPVLPPPANPNAKPATSAASGDLFVPAARGPSNSAAESLPIPPQASQPATPGVKRPFMRPAAPREPAKGKLVVGEEPMPAPEGAPPIVNGTAAVETEGIVIHPTPPIDYDVDRDARKMYRTGKIDLVMLTTDPTTNCTYEIPMCIPGCCVGDPIVSSKRGIFGRGVVQYRWPNGFRAIVKFRHVLGDVEVEYEGD